MLLADLVPPVPVKLIRCALRRPEINPTPDGVGQFAPGHFYSPIPSPDDVTARLEFSRAKTPQFPRHPVINEQLQFRLLERFAGCLFPPGVPCLQPRMADL